MSVLLGDVVLRVSGVVVLLGLLEFGDELSVDDGVVVLLGDVVLGDVVVPGEVCDGCCVLIDGCWSEGVVVCAMLIPAALTMATTAAMLNVFDGFLMRLTPFPVRICNDENCVPVPSSRQMACRRAQLKAFLADIHVVVRTTLAREPGAAT
jgi:hypothetical protein